MRAVIQTFRLVWLVQRLPKVTKPTTKEFWAKKSRLGNSFETRLFFSDENETENYWSWSAEEVGEDNGWKLKLKLIWSTPKNREEKTATALRDLIALKLPRQQLHSTIDKWSFSSIVPTGELIVIARSSVGLNFKMKSIIKASINRFSVMKLDLSITDNDTSSIRGHCGRNWKWKGEQSIMKK